MRSVQVEIIDLELVALRASNPSFPRTQLETPHRHWVAELGASRLEMGGGVEN
jgi:hypothetical protein